MVVVGFVLLVDVYSSVCHAVSEVVGSLTCNGYIAGLRQAAYLITEIKKLYSCPETAIGLVLVRLKEPAPPSDVGQCFQLSQ